MKYVCDICGWEYDESKGMPEQGIAPGTKFSDLPEDFECPMCTSPKSMFALKEGQEPEAVEDAAKPDAQPQSEEPVVTQMDPSVMFKLSYGLFVLVAKEGEKDNGCIINTAVQVTQTPNRISICVNKSNLTHDMVLRTGQFNVCVIKVGADPAVFKRFGYQSGRDADKFEGCTAVRRSANGLYYTPMCANAYLSCKVVTTADLGTHTWFLADVIDGEVLTADDSLTYAEYQKTIKKAKEKDTAAKGWRCKVCGYVYEGEELPADFICPVCKHPASDFEKIG